MTAQAIGTGLAVAAVCGLAAFIALMRQAGRHSDDRAVLLLGQLDAFRAGQESARGQGRVPGDGPWPGPEWWDSQFDGITSGLGSREGEGP